MIRTYPHHAFKALVLCLCLGLAPRVYAADSVALENTKPGTTTWKLTNPASMCCAAAPANDLNASDYAKPEIQGYASKTSVNQGDSIDFYVRTINTNPYSLSIFRMGWYNGLGGRLMLGPVTLTGVVQPMPPAPVYQPTGTGLVECNWSASYHLTIPTDWVSGIYLVKLSLSSPVKESYIIFVVRDDARNSAVLMQASFATYQAYNEWGGSSLYTLSGGSRTGVKVSFNRPYWRNFGVADFIDLAGTQGYELQLVRWLERQGYDVTYATDLDTHENPNLLLSHNVFLVTAHDEYWSWNMRDNVERGRDSGVSLGFLGANASYWQVRFEPSSSGIPDRTIVGYKDLAAQDPNSDPRYVTTLWRNIRPEGAMMGVQYNGVSNTTQSDIVITNPSHWLLNGAGSSNGSTLLNVLGYETDSLYLPSGATVLAHSPFPKGAPQVYADMTIYTAASGADVFATGSVWWSLGLDSLWPSPGIVPGVQQITANFLSRELQTRGAQLRVTTSSLAGGTVGVSYNSTLAAMGGTRPYSWSIASGVLPPGLTLSSGGVISGTPSQGGSFSFTAAVTDSSSPVQTATQTLTLNVSAPVVVGRLPATVTTSSAALLYPASYAGDRDFTTQWVASLIPDSKNNNAWIMLDFGTSTTLQDVKWQGATGNPYPASSPTSYSIQVSNDGTTWQTVITRSNSAPVVNGNEPLSVSARFLRMLTTKVGDGTGWSLSFFEFWAEGPTSSPLTIITNALPSGTVGVAYNSTLTASGGTPPYGWSLTSGGLPPGLALSTSGIISGSPSQSGSFAFTVQATDSASAPQTATQPLTVTVSPAAVAARLPATVSTSAAVPLYPSSYAGDGDFTTQWVASVIPDSNNNNAWIQLDFGATRSLQSLKWQGADRSPYPAWSPTIYCIQVSNDGTSWQTVITRSNTSPVVNGNESLNVQARFLRMLTSEVGDGTGWSLSFFEFWVEGY